MNAQSGKSTLFMAQLHNPVQKIELLKKDLLAKEVHYKSDVVFLASKHGPNLFYELKEGVVKINMTKLKKQDKIR